MLLNAVVQVDSLGAGSPDIERVAQVVHHLESLTFQVHGIRGAALEVTIDGALLEALVGASLPADGGPCDTRRMSAALQDVVESVVVHPFIVSLI